MSAIRYPLLVALIAATASTGWSPDALAFACAVLLCAAGLALIVTA